MLCAKAEWHSACVDALSLTASEHTVLAAAIQLCCRQQLAYCAASSYSAVLPAAGTMCCQQFLMCCAVLHVQVPDDVYDSELSRFQGMLHHMLSN
jgi:hypothetical protein